MKEVEIVGNQGALDDNCKANVKVRKGRGSSLTARSAQRLVKTSADNLKRVYEAAGFSSVTVTPEVKRTGGNISVAFRVKEGPQDIVESFHVVGNNTVPVSTLRRRTEGH